MVEAEVNDIIPSMPSFRTPMQSKKDVKIPIDKLRTTSVKILFINFVINLASRLTENSWSKYYHPPSSHYQKNVLIPVFVLTRQVGNVSWPPKCRSRLKIITSLGALPKCVKDAKFKQTQFSMILLI